MKSALVCVAILACALTASAQKKHSYENLSPTQQAVLRAVLFAKDQGVFTESVVIRIEEKEEAITIKFERPTSGIINEKGRKDGKLLITVELKGMTMEAKAEKLSLGSDNDLTEAKFHGEAAVAVLQHRYRSGIAAKDVEIRVKRTDEGYSVLLQRIPYLPGGHTGYELNRDLQVTAVHPGA